MTEAVTVPMEVRQHNSRLGLGLISLGVVLAGILCLFLSGGLA